MRLSAVAPGDTKAPCNMALKSDEQKQKEAIVFDEAIKEVCETYWKDVTNNGHPVKAVGVPCIQTEGNFHYKDHDEIASLLKKPIRQLRDDKESLKELEFLLNHVDRKNNELVFMKCSDGSCDHCTLHPVRAKKLFKFLNGNKMLLFNPMESDQHPGHYYTFLEMCKKSAEHVHMPVGNEGLSSEMNAEHQFGKSHLCPSYSFSSKTEKQRHISLICFTGNKRRERDADVQRTHVHNTFVSIKPLQMPQVDQENAE